MCNNHAPASALQAGQECQIQTHFGLSATDFLRLTQSDREAALRLFLKDVPQAYTDPANRLLMEQAFDGYLVFLQEQPHKPEIAHVH
jgi:hypothetical protein